MNDLISLNYIDRQVAVDALEDWEEKYAWDDWCRMHKDEKEKYKITAPSDVLKELQPALPSGAVITTDMLEYCSSVEKFQEKINEIINSPELQTSRIEKELHGKTPEEQYEFIYWLLFKSFEATAYSNSRLAIIDWLKGDDGDAHD